MFNHIFLLWLVGTWTSPPLWVLIIFQPEAPNNCTLPGLIEYHLTSIKLSIQLKAQVDPYAEFWSFFSPLLPPLWYSALRIWASSGSLGSHSQFSDTTVLSLDFPNLHQSLANASRSKVAVVKRFTTLLFSQGSKPCTAYCTKCMK